MLSKFRNLFSKQPKDEDRPIVVLPEDRLSEYLQNLSNQKITDILLQSEQLKSQISEKSKSIVTYALVLKEAKVEDPRANASAKVKDKFVSKVLSNLENINLPNFSNLEDIENFLNDINKKLLQLKLSPKESLHINYFFGENFKQVAQEIDALISTINSMLALINSDSVLAKSRIENTLFEINLTKENLQKKEKQISDTDIEIISLDSKINSIQLLDVSELQDATDKISANKKRQGQIKQSITSNFGSVEKLLKKIIHSEVLLKSDSDLLKKYILDPPLAFIEDRQIKIRNILINVILLAKDGKMKFENKSESKLVKLLNNLDNLVDLRSEEEKLQKDLENFENKLNELKDKESENKKRLKEKTNLDSEKSSLIKEKQKVLEEIENQKTLLQKHMQSLEQDFSIFSGSNVKIEQKILEN